MSDSCPSPSACTVKLRASLLAELGKMTPADLADRPASLIADWLFDSESHGINAMGAALGEHAEHLEAHLAVIEAFQEMARRLFYIGRVHAADRTKDWDTRLLWDFTSAVARDLYETAQAVVTLTADGMDAPAKVLLRHAMELYGRQLVVLRDPKEQRAFLDQLQRLRDFQQASPDIDGAASEHHQVGLVGGALMDRVAIIEQNLDESSLQNREQIKNTASLLRDVYAYFSNLTHGGPELVDDVLYVYDPSFPSGQRRRAWAFGKPTRDGDLTLHYLTMLLWQFWRIVPRALERGGMGVIGQGDIGVLLAAARGLERAVAECFGTRLFSENEAAEF
jgi:hypothetical protein